MKTNTFRLVLLRVIYFVLLLAIAWGVCELVFFAVELSAMQQSEIKSFTLALFTGIYVLDKWQRKATATR